MPSPGGSSERLQTYIAITDLSQAGDIFGLASEDENIKAEVLDAQRAIDLLDQGLIEAGPAVICLSYFARHHEELKSIR